MANTNETQGDRKSFYFLHLLQYPANIVGKLLYLHWSKYRPDIFDESVTLFILALKSANLMESGIGKHSSPCMAFLLVLSAYHTGVGYCLFDSRLCRAPEQINRLLHTFV